LLKTELMTAIRSTHLREEFGIETIAPHRPDRKRARTQDGRALRRYMRRWKIERLFGWLLNDRRADALVTSRERS